MTIAITGATGFVGKALLDLMGDAGLEVRALARQPQGGRIGVEWVSGDLHDSAALSKLVSGAEAVIHIAGVVNTHDVAEFERGNVGGTLNLIEAARAAGVERFVHVSSLSAREPNLSAYGGSKARSERLVKASGLDWTIVRPPAVYGPGDKDMFELFRGAKWGVVPVPQIGRASLIHVSDLARLLIVLIPGGELVTHQIFEPDDGKERGWNHYEMARAIGWAMGGRPWVPGLSKETLEWAAKADKLLRGKKARLTLDRVGYMTHPDWVVSRAGRVPIKLWQPRIDTRQGFKATAKWYRDEGWV